MLRGGLVFDGTRKGHGTVVLEGDRVKQVIFGDALVTAGEAVDVSGMTVLPGLIDMHAHLLAEAAPFSTYVAEDPEAHLKAMLRAGVTSYVDLGSSAHVIFDYRRRIAAGRMLGPRIFAAGPLLTPTGGHPCYAGTPPGDMCIFVDAPEAAAEALSPLFAMGPDLVKIVVDAGGSWPIPRLSEASIAAIEQAAQASHLQVTAHVGAPADVEDALQAGVRLFAHVPIDGAISPVLARKMAASGVVVTPTLAVVDAFYRFAHGTLHEVDDPALVDDVPAVVIDALRDPRARPSSDDAALTTAWRANAFASVERLCSAGVTLVAGTDAGNPGTFHGLALARELSLLVEAGLSPEAALCAATRTAADVLGRRDLGRLEPGAVADVLVVQGDATADVRAVARVARVYKDGALLDREALALPRGTSLDARE